MYISYTDHTLAVDVKQHQRVGRSDKKGRRGFALAKEASEGSTSLLGNSPKEA